MGLAVLNWNTKTLPHKAGSAKLSIHISKLISKIASALTSKKLNTNTATEPFIAQSNNEKVGTTDANTY